MPMQHRGRWPLRAGEIDRRSLILGAGAASALGVTTARAHDLDSPYKFERGFPAAGTTEKAYDAIDLRRAVGFFGIYGPQASAFDGTWKLNDIGEVKGL